MGNLTSPFLFKEILFRLQGALQTSFRTVFLFKWFRITLRIESLRTVWTLSYLLHAIIIVIESSCDTARNASHSRIDSDDRFLRDVAVSLIHHHRLHDYQGLGYHICRTKRFPETEGPLRFSRYGKIFG
jgi:hypothetical protein